MTINFTLNNTTTILFGQGMIGRLGTVIGAAERVLLLYGGGSIKKNGVHAAVMNALSDRFVIEFGGIEPNPEYDSILRAAVEARRHGITFVLGVGGGSVIDAAKFLASIVPLDEGDAWDQMVGGISLPPPLPNGAVLTLPATGSESNPVSVVSRASRGLKLPFACEVARPRFAVLDPSTMKSLPQRQLENGVVDAVTHVLEQYLTQPVNVPVQAGFSETLLSVLFEWGPRLIDENSDEARETIMWAANQSLNGLIGSGVPQDWSTHMIGHALTALYGIDHARSLSVVMPHLLRHKFRSKLTMLARYGRRIWGLTGDDETVAEAAISATQDFFQKMGCPVHAGDLTGIQIDPDKVIRHLVEASQLPLGENRDIFAEDVHAILRASGV